MKKLWGGGYRSKTSPVIEAFTQSIRWDHPLALEDLAGSIAHAKMLGKCGIIPTKKARQLVQGLKALTQDWSSGKTPMDSAGAEDIHSLIQAALERKVGKVAEALHTARSRNDQVITDTRLFCLRKTRVTAEQVKALQRVLVETASQHRSLVVPGYTHLQHAQPVLWAHWLLSYCEALERDRQRLRDAATRLDELPLGSGALAGTSLPIDRRWVAKQLGFSKISSNSIDAVSDRDGPLELLSTLAILGIHLSRMAEDLLLWVSPGFGFLQLDERLLTGSSMMPQKQNPDFLELTRAGAGILIGKLTGLLSVLKGLPTGYNRDLQVDKEHLIEAVDLSGGMLQVLTEGFKGLKIKRQKIEEALKDESLYATDLAEVLVGQGVSFAQAHRAVGELMGYCRRAGKSPSQLPVKILQQFSPHFDSGIHRLLNPAVSVSRKRSLGSTNPHRVLRELRRWKVSLRR